MLRDLLSSLLDIPTRNGLRETVPFDSGGRLEITNYMGSISIRSWDRAELAVTADLDAPAWLPHDEGERVIKQTRIRLAGDRRSRQIVPDFSAIPTTGQRDFRTLPVIHFALHVPAQLALVLRDRKSNIELAGLRGDLDVQTYRGTVTARDLRGSWRGETQGGSIRLERFRGRFDVTARRGSIDLAAVTMEGDSRLVVELGHASLGLAGQQGFSLHADLRPGARLSGRVGRQNLHFAGRQVAADLGRSSPRLVVESHQGDIRITG
jgi:hypothetical protein